MAFLPSGVCRLCWPGMNTAMSVTIEMASSTLSMVWVAGLTTGIANIPDAMAQAINFLERYDEQLKARHGKLMLAGVSQHAKEQLDRTETTDDLLGEENIFEATDILGESGQAAYRAAQDWLEGLEPED